MNSAVAFNGCRSNFANLCNSYCLGQKLPFRFPPPLLLCLIGAPMAAIARFLAIPKTTVLEERASGVARDRPPLKAALDYMRQGDTLVVWKLDRLARSTSQLIETV
jgi:hypothetical protein